MMKAYLISIAGAAIATSAVGILAPEGERDGLAKHIRLLTALLLAVMLISPVVSLINGIGGALSGEIVFPWEGDGDVGEVEDIQAVLDGAAADYVTDLLTQSLEQEFGIPRGEIRCLIEWDRSEAEWRPIRATVILSGSAIWSDPAELEAHVTSLLGCECVSAIE